MPLYGVHPFTSNLSTLLSFLLFLLQIFSSFIPYYSSSASFISLSLHCLLAKTSFLTFYFTDSAHYIQIRLPDKWNQWSKFHARALNHYISLCCSHSGFQAAGQVPSRDEGGEEAAAEGAGGGQGRRQGGRTHQEGARRQGWHQHRHHPQ